MESIGLMDCKRVTVFAGHYGSGKTNIAVNYALMLRRKYKEIAIADLDTVNPYFRTKDSESALKQYGIRLISSVYANTNVDMPALPGEAYAVLDDKRLRAVLDVGGDDRGALALGRYSEAILAENDYEMLFVINKYRPLTRDAESAAGILREVETAGKLPFTAIVNNSNLGEETTAQDVLDSRLYALEVSALTGLPVKMTTVKKELAGELEGTIDNLFPLTLYVRQSWQKQQEEHYG